jgi:hypothetical protein
VTHLPVSTDPSAARDGDDDDHVIVVPPEDRIIMVPPRTPDDCLVALSNGSRWWVSLPPDVRALLPRSLSYAFKCDVFDLSFPLKQRHRPRKPSSARMIVAAQKAGASSVTTPDGTIINFGQESSGADAPRDASVVAPDRIVELRKRGK